MPNKVDDELPEDDAGGQLPEQVSSQLPEGQAGGKLPEQVEVSFQVNCIAVQGEFTCF